MPSCNALEARFDYWFRLNEENGFAPQTFPIDWIDIGRICRIKKVLLGFPTKLSRSAPQKHNASILGHIRRHLLKCQKGNHILHLALFDTSPRQSIPNGRGVLLKHFARNRRLSYPCNLKWRGGTIRTMCDIFAPVALIWASRHMG